MAPRKCATSLFTMTHSPWYIFQKTDIDWLRVGIFQKTDIDWLHVGNEAAEKIEVSEMKCATSFGRCTTTDLCTLVVT